VRRTRHALWNAHSGHEKPFVDALVNFHKTSMPQSIFHCKPLRPLPIETLAGNPNRCISFSICLNIRQKNRASRWKAHAVRHLFFDCFLLFSIGPVLRWPDGNHPASFRFSG
jgi:hypothetical protein